MLPPNIDEKEEKRLKELWESICREKIQDAYKEYLKVLKDKL
ncbi:hypothetical protein PaecuDRAFT_1749 [Paenibacillus curdlanolyticus YK9]|uniref:Uncharacterized protein n=1 Tax=Paenibacillus curdlanolyticus YK9 TaxID=717606 RepID=E0I7Z8_9BACL|nr:hypothetical protein PaecuDRAFT_1749 [Paenibacillus curdlanolyticus YK9]